MLQIARECIKQGDFSPLFMIPKFAQVSLDEGNIQAYGYFDLSTFALGGKITPSTFNTTRYQSSNPIIKVDNIGMVRSVRRVDWDTDSWQIFSDLLSIITEFTGTDISVLVDTLGGRLYGQISDRILERLSENDRMSQFWDKLHGFLNSKSENSDNILRWIAEAIGLSDRALECPMTGFSPLQFLKDHGDTLHFGHSGPLVDVICHNCHENFPVRVGLLKPHPFVLGAKAYRILGPKYAFSLTGEAGLLVEDGGIIEHSFGILQRAHARSLKRLRFRYMTYLCHDLTPMSMGGRRIENGIEL